MDETGQDEKNAGKFGEANSSKHPSQAAEVRQSAERYIRDKAETKSTTKSKTLKPGGQKHS